MRQSFNSRISVFQTDDAGALPTDHPIQRARDVTESMQGFEPCRESANLSGRTNFIGSQLDVPERHDPNVEVARGTILKRWKVQLQPLPGAPLSPNAPVV